MSSKFCVVVPMCQSIYLWYWSPVCFLFFSGFHPANWVMWTSNVYPVQHKMCCIMWTLIRERLLLKAQFQKCKNLIFYLEGLIKCISLNMDTTDTDTVFKLILVKKDLQIIALCINYVLNLNLLINCTSWQANGEDQMRTTDCANCDMIYYISCLFLILLCCSVYVFKNCMPCVNIDASQDERS